MFVAKKHIARRTFLRGAGVTLALPLLESMVPALTPSRLTAAAPVRRFVGIWHPHGAAPGYWSPLQEGKNFEFKNQHDYDLHIALEVSREHFEKMIARARERGVEMRGVSDHQFIDSIYFRDPNGYVIELTAKRPNHDEATDLSKNSARGKLDACQQKKAGYQR